MAVSQAADDARRLFARGSAGLAAHLAGLRPTALLLLLCLVSACAPRPGPSVLTPVSATVPGSKLVTIYVATDRRRKFPNSNIYTDGRAPHLNYAEFKISIPPGHRAGQIEWPNGNFNPATSFTVVQQDVLDEHSFVQRIAHREKRHSHPKVGIFVHGFNTNFQEALFRFAQMAADADTDGTAILFAWPSAAEVTGYVEDRDSVAYSRDQLVQLLTLVAKQPTDGQITVIGHSMGAWLTSEALRQLRLMHRDSVIDRLKVVLAAPDIDVDVFRAEMAVIGPLSPPMTVLVSRDDVALSVSSMIAGARHRLGLLSVDDPRVQEGALKANVQVVDISQLKTSDAFKHDRFADLAAYYPKLAAETGSGAGDLRRAGAYVFDSLGATLASPLHYAGTALAGQ